MTFRPMLASPADFAHVKFPVLASPKIDGIRGLVKDSKLVTRKLLEVPNRHVFERLSTPDLEGLDGELCVGPPNAPDLMRKTTSGLMRRDGEPDFTFWVFDLHDEPEAPYHKRFGMLEKALTTYIRAKHNIALLPQHEVKDIDALMEFEKRIVESGYEGVIIRSPKSLYKYGRSTAREGILLKVKRFEDSEALIVGFEEEMENTNEATKDNLGRTKRSSAKSGKVGKGTLGAFIARDLRTGVEFSVGGGLTADDRIRFWADRKHLDGRILKYKFFPVGVKEAPRHPVFLGFRDPKDM